jgi:hypothetical protein
MAECDEVPPCPDAAHCSQYSPDEWKFTAVAPSYNTRAMDPNSRLHRIHKVSAL